MKFNILFLWRYFSNINALISHPRITKPCVSILYFVYGWTTIRFERFPPFHLTVRVIVRHLTWLRMPGTATWVVSLLKLLYLSSNLADHFLELHYVKDCLFLIFYHFCLSSLAVILALLVQQFEPLEQARVCF